MDVPATAATFVCILLVCYAGPSTPYPQNDLQALDVTTVSNSINATPAMKCETARGLLGSCMDRQFCEYSTYAIDLSLYAPKSYKKSCGDKETCCPFGFQINITETKNTWNDKEMGFDENDK